MGNKIPEDSAPIDSMNGMDMSAHSEHQHGMDMGPLSFSCDGKPVRQCFGRSLLRWSACQAGDSTKQPQHTL
eukprot:904815-Pelagomonas_calceolata.AAC.1